MPADTWLAALVETSIRLSVLLLVAGAIALVLRRSSANLRHLVWALALAGALMLPLGASYLPTLSLPVPRSLLAFARVAETAVAVPRSETPMSVPSGVSLREDTDDTDRPAAVPARASTQPIASAASDAAGPPVVVPMPPGDHVAPTRNVAAPSWPQLLTGLWMVGVVVLLLRIGLGMVVMQRLGRRATSRPDGEWEKLAAELGRRIGLIRPVRILSSARTVVPMTWGWLRPVVLVPEAGAVWSAARKRVVLLHELTHVKRHDCASQLVAHVACAVYWFNPLVWRAARALRIEGERACDEAVVHDGTRASSYADHLLEIARAHQDMRWSSVVAVAMARRSQLEARLLSILDAGPRRPPSRRMVSALGTVMAVVILMLTAVTPTTRASAPLEAGVLTAKTETTTGVSLEGVVTQAPTDPGVPAVGQTPAADNPGARNPDPRVVELFVESLTDDDAEVRERAAWGLGRNRVETAVSPLSNTLRDEIPAVRERAAWALGRIRSRSAVPGLAAALDDSEVTVRAEVVEALGLIRDASAVEPLVGALRDSEPRVRREAAEALGKIRHAGAVDGLVAALSDAEPAVVEHVVEALGRIGGTRALDALVEMTGDASPAVREAVIKALSGRRW